MGRALIDVQNGELILRVQEEEVTFSVFNAIKHPNDNEICFSVDLIEAIVSSQIGHSKPLETSLSHEDPSSCDDKDVRGYVKWMDSFSPNSRTYFESLGASPCRSIPSIEKPPTLEEKPLLTHLRYTYLAEAFTLPVIISSSLSHIEEERLLRVLREHKEAIRWSLAYIEGNRPSMCMHIILLEDDIKPTMEAKRRLNPTMKQVVRKKVLKWLDS